MHRRARVTIVQTAITMALLAAPRALHADDTNATVDDAAEQRRIALLLSDYETLPDPRSLPLGGPRAARILFELYRSTEQPTFIRVRALRTLSLFPADVAAPKLVSVTRESGVRPVFLREAALGLARCAGESAVEVLASLLSRPDKLARRAAIDALQTLATPGARHHLAAHRVQESDPALRDALDAALATTPRR